MLSSFPLSARVDTIASRDGNHEIHARLSAQSGEKAMAFRPPALTTLRKARSLPSPVLCSNVESLFARVIHNP